MLSKFIILRQYIIILICNSIHPLSIYNLCKLTLVVFRDYFTQQANYNSITLYILMLPFVPSFPFSFNGSSTILLPVWRLDIYFTGLYKNTTKVIQLVTCTLHTCIQFSRRPLSSHGNCLIKERELLNLSLQNKIGFLLDWPHLITND